MAEYGIKKAQLHDDLIGEIDGILTKLESGGYTGTAQDLHDLITSIIADAQYINGVTPTSAIVPATGNVYTVVTTAGTYVNWNNIVVPTNTLAVLSRVDGVFSSSQSVYGVKVSQGLGTSVDAVMSQNAVNNMDLYYKNLLKYYDSGLFTLVFQQGRWTNIGDSVPTNVPQRICTLPFLIKKASVLSIVLPVGMQYGVVYFNDTLSVSVTAPTWLTASTFTLGSAYNYIAIQLSYVSNANIIPANASGFSVTGQITHYGKNIVQETGQKDDAIMSQKAVSDAIDAISVSSNGVISSSTPAMYSTQNHYNTESNLLFKKAVTQMNIVSSVNDLIIIAGQSNADGRVPKANAPSWLVDLGYTITNYMIWKPSSNAFESYNIDTNNGSYGDSASKFSFDIYFAKAYLDANPTKKLYAIRQTVGGVPITELGFSSSSNRFYRWQPITSKITSGDLSMCDVLITKIKNALSYSASNSLQLNPIAVLYHQGEGDADRVSNGGVTNYLQNLSNLKSWFRGLFSASSLPFLNGQIVGTYNSSYVDINDIFTTMNASDPYMKTVNMSTQFGNTLDGLHYNETGVSYLGNQMYLDYLDYNL